MILDKSDAAHPLITTCVCFERCFLLQYRLERTNKTMHTLERPCQHTHTGRCNTNVVTTQVSLQQKCPCYKRVVATQVSLQRKRLKCLCRRSVYATQVSLQQKCLSLFCRTSLSLQETCLSLFCRTSHAHLIINARLMYHASISAPPNPTSICLVKDRCM